MKNKKIHKKYFIRKKSIDNVIDEKIVLREIYTG